MKLGLLILSLMIFSGCASLDSVSITPVPVNRSQKVKAEAERSIFLGFNFDNDYVNQITNDLKNQCTNGTVTGLMTKTETINYFLFFFWKKKVSATGYCVPSKLAARSGEVRKRRPSDASEDDSVSDNTIYPTPAETGTL